MQRFGLFERQTQSSSVPLKTGDCSTTVVLDEAHGQSIHLGARVCEGVDVRHRFLDSFEPHINSRLGDKQARCYGDCDFAMSRFFLSSTCYRSSIKTAPIITVGNRAHRNNFAAEIPSSPN